MYFTSQGKGMVLIHFINQHQQLTGAKCKKSIEWDSYQGYTL